jgi:hypothetical protein
MPDPDLLRRRDDALLTALQTEVALLKQHNDLTSKTDDARFGRIDEAFKAQGAKLDRILDGQNDPDATPSGRALRAEIKDTRDDVAVLSPKVEAHEELRQQLIGATRVARLAMAVAGMTAIGNAIGLVADILRAPHP